MESFWNSSNLFKILIKWKWHILIITSLGMLLTAGATFLIKPKYKSYAVVYPVNLGEYSEESFTEQMMQILNSRDIMDNVINKFNLSEHYKIDTNYKHYRSTMYYLYQENVNISRTEYESVEIKVLDTDPQLASDMVEAILEFYNLKVATMHKLKLKELMVINDHHQANFKLKNDSIVKAMDILRKDYGILDYGSQVSELTQGIYRSQGNSVLIGKAEKQLDNIKQHGEAYLKLEQAYDTTLDLFFKYRLELDQQEIEYQKDITYAQVVTSPYPSDIKFSPDRVSIILISGLAILSLLILIIGMIEKSKK